ncbi:MAG: hypothetical protein AB7O62_25340 [Pirellulales bacterium]
MAIQITRRWALGGIAAMAALLAGGSIVCAAGPDAAAPLELRVLFLGNSQIYFNELPRMVEALSESAPPDRPRIKAGQYVAGGASLQSLWEAGTDEGKPQALIASQPWDVVIVQEIYTYYSKPETFEKYATLFEGLIRRHNARPVLYCTASINDLYPEGFHKLHEMQMALGKKLNVPVCAAGQSWLEYWGESPSLEQRLDLYHTDKAHPGVKGSYLNACALYAQLTGTSPVGLTHRMPKQPADAIPADQARQMQEAAWSVYQEINEQVEERP